MVHDCEPRQIAQRLSEMELSRELRASESRLCRGEEERAEAFLPPREARGHSAIRIVLSICVCRLRLANGGVCSAE
jgi:hypothetical protein